MPSIDLDLETTALVLVDLNNGLLSVDMQPHSAETVLGNGVALAQAFRAQGCTVVLTTTALPAPPTERVRPVPPGPAERDMSALAKVATVPDWHVLADDLDLQPGDVVIRKPTWSAFFATDLDLQLRRRGIRTLVLGGVATNFGVEGTGRDARALGYGVILAEDAARALTAEEHAASVTYSFPMMGRVRSTADLVAAVSAI